MRTHRFISIFAVMFSFLVIPSRSGWTEDKASRPVMTAIYTSQPVKIDGILNDPVWRKAPSYALCLADDAAHPDGTTTPIEKGEARLAWDEKNLYVAIRYEDSDIVAENDKDQAEHYLTGDLGEVFLKPEANTWYWELYVTPHSHKSTFWFPGRGRMGLPSNFNYKMELHVAGKCYGTLNKWEDRDQEWTGEMAIPIKELTRHGDSFGPGSKWTILVARYNYSRYLPTKGPELTMTPKLPETSYHYPAGYAKLELKR